MKSIHCLSVGTFIKMIYTMIVENKIGFDEISKYTDGWYSCLPFVDFCVIYDKNDIQDNYLGILHNSLFARTSNRDFLGNWNLLLGKILIKYL